jgi:hypothetical protein
VEAGFRENPMRKQENRAQFRLIGTSGAQTGKSE